MTQAVWSTAHGRFLETTDLAGDADLAPRGALRPHPRRVRSTLVVWPDPTLLLVVQAIAVALGAPAVFLLARKHLATERGGARVRAGLPALPGRPVARRDGLPSRRARDAVAALGLLVPRRGSARRLRRGRRGRLSDQGARRPRRWRRSGSGTRWRAAGSERGSRSPSPALPWPSSRSRSSCRTCARRRRHRSPRGTTQSAGRPAGSSKTSSPIRRPWRARRRRAATCATWRTCSGRSAGCRCCRPASLTALPELAANLLSSTRTQTSIHFHYTAGAIPGLIVGGDLRRGPARAARRRLARGSRSSGRLGVVANSARRRCPPGDTYPAARRSARDAHRARARPHAEGARADPGGRNGQRDQHARRPSVRAAADLQLSTRGRRPGSPSTRGGRRTSTRLRRGPLRRAAGREPCVDGRWRLMCSRGRRARLSATLPPPPHNHPPLHPPVTPATPPLDLPTIGPSGICLWQEVRGSGRAASEARGHGPRPAARVTGQARYQTREVWRSSGAGAPRRAPSRARPRTPGGRGRRRRRTRRRERKATESGSPSCSSRDGSA